MLRSRNAECCASGPGHSAEYLPASRFAAVFGPLSERRYPHHRHRYLQAGASGAEPLHRFCHYTERHRAAPADHAAAHGRSGLPLRRRFVAAGLLWRARGGTEGKGGAWRICRGFFRIALLHLGQSHGPPDRPVLRRGFVDRGLPADAPQKIFSQKIPPFLTSKPQYAILKEQHILKLKSAYYPLFRVMEMQRICEVTATPFKPGDRRCPGGEERKVPA